MNQRPLLLTILFLLSAIISGCASAAGQTPSITPTVATAALTDTLSPTALPTSTATAVPTATIAPAPVPGAIQTSPTDGMEMVYVPAGDFSMGSLGGPADEQPVHTIHLDAYWIDRAEVTNGMYYQCVQAGDCLRPYISGSNTRSYYFSNPVYVELPSHRSQVEQRRKVLCLGRTEPADRSRMGESRPWDGWAHLPMGKRQSEQQPVEFQQSRWGYGRRGEISEWSQSIRGAGYGRERD